MVIDASAVVDLLVGSPVADAVRTRLAGSPLHAPAHFDAEVLSALGRLHRAGLLTADQSAARVERLAAAPVQRHLLAPLLAGAFVRRQNLRLVDALYVELAERLEGTLVTTDRKLATVAGELVENRP